MTHADDVSPRIILAILIAVIALVILYTYWDGNLTSMATLTGLGLGLVAAHLIWLEMSNQDLKD